jgi:hypothetical protein
MKQGIDLKFIFFSFLNNINKIRAILKKREFGDKKKEETLEEILNRIWKYSFPVHTYYHCIYTDYDNTYKTANICFKFIPDIAKIKEKMIYAVKNFSNLILI